MLSEEKKYNVIYSKQSLIALVLIVVPMVIVLSVLFLTLGIRNLPEWLILTFVLSSIVVSLALTLYLVFVKLTVACEVTIADNEIMIVLDKTNIFYKRKLLKTSWANVKNVSLNAVRGGARSFAQITFSEPSETITFSPLKGETADENQWDFWLDLSQRVENYNAQGTTKIDDRGFYESPGAAILTVLSIIAVVVVTVFKIIDPEGIPWFRLLAVYAFAGIWFTNVKAARDKRKNKTPQKLG